MIAPRAQPPLRLLVGALQRGRRPESGRPRIRPAHARGGPAARSRTALLLCLELAPRNARARCRGRDGFHRMERVLRDLVRRRPRRHESEPGGHPSRLSRTSPSSSASTATAPARPTGPKTIPAGSGSSRAITRSSASVLGSAGSSSSTTTTTGPTGVTRASARSSRGSMASSTSSAFASPPLKRFAGNRAPSNPSRS